MQLLEEEVELRESIENEHQENKDDVDDDNKKPLYQIHEFVLPILGSALVFLIAFSLRDAISASFDLIPIKTHKVWTMWILVLLKLVLVVAIYVTLNFVGLTKVFPGC